MDTRKIEITFCTTPPELRLIADELEQNETVQINWYHTRLIFKMQDVFQLLTETDEKINPAEVHGLKRLCD